jgi:hypothetical protein
VVEAFQTFRPRCSTDREAHEQIAAAIVRGEHLWFLTKSEREACALQSFHPGSVKRILREFKAR